MTTFKIEVLIVYKNNKPIEVVGIEDGYTDVQISKEITDELRDKYGVYDMGGGAEAKDFTGVYGPYEIKIETKDINI